MNIDDPQRALEAQIEAEERAQSPLTRYIPGIADVFAALPTEVSAKLLAKGAAWFIRKAQDDRRQALTDVLSSELRWVKDKLREVTEEHARFVQEVFPELVLDAFEKAEQTRSRERIDRIGRIVANAAVSGPAKPADTTEELSRIAMALDDSDVRVLTELVSGQRDSFEPSLGSVPGELVNNYWRSGEKATHETPASTRSQKGGMLSGVAIRLGIPEGDLQARCAKLQAFGLVVQVERNQTKNGPGTLPYAILTRGIEFVDAIRSLADSEPGL